MTVVEDSVVVESYEYIKTIEATFSWPHPIKKGYFVSASFVRDENNKPYLLYCPCSQASILIGEKIQEDYWFVEKYIDSRVREVTFNHKLYTDSDIFFYLIYLGKHEPKKISKKEIEKMFEIQVED